jgi:hypothetical protein
VTATVGSATKAAGALAAAAEGQAPSGGVTGAVEGQVQVNQPRSAESSSGHARPGAGTLPGVG